MTSKDEHNDPIPWYMYVLYFIIWIIVVPVLVLADNWKHLNWRRIKEIINDKQDPWGWYYGLSFVVMLIFFSPVMVGMKIVEKFKRKS